ncbi:molybdopterin-synthase adenylyltransferase MoeB [Bowmanella dokdonensis]|uniref:Molybdopterin-synthase adenylyltransferase n=1 Tax=Bowmanella dokdonensis TaxID=751969 RepID=A0A939DLE0_9ALTE|nr:molybdopterin-synthase adenylyltransferase MoeB [Bowmanella dokdonensis]MBN7823946.1 molybdopterin-synthase adenylyltransferase MoeB [Bowmanella dokdonensis]
MITIHIPTPLRRFTANHNQVQVSGSTVNQALQTLAEQHPGLQRQIFDENGQLRHFINVFINADDIRLHEGQATAVSDGDELELLPAIAGGNLQALTSAEWRSQLEDEIEQLRASAAMPWLQDHQDAQILDVRTREEWTSGHIPRAVHLDKGYLEVQIESRIPDRNTPVLVYCASGVRSLFAARTLQMLGYRRVINLAGGIVQWKNAGLPIETPDFLSSEQRARYLRHLAIPEVGENGQLTLLKSRVLLIGAGGLGCPAAIYLAAAGVGTLGLVDDDVVDRTNLQRQILHTEDAVGSSKIESIQSRVRQLNSSVNINLHPLRLDKASAADLFARYDVIVDCSDNFDTRYIINDEAAALGKPVVHGSVYRFDGQVSVFWAGKGPCYRCLYPAAPPPELAPPCAEAGVLGVLPGTIGLLQATEVLKLLLDMGRPLIGRSLCFDALNASFREIRYAADPHCACCTTVVPGRTTEVYDEAV